MEHECGACDGSGVCQDRFHDTSGPFEALGAMVVDAIGDTCPACGQGAGDPGKCSVCGGTGWQDD